MIYKTFPNRKVCRNRKNRNDWHSIRAHSQLSTMRVNVQVITVRVGVSPMILMRNSCFLLICLILLNITSHSVEAGLCWSSPNRNGRCTDLLKTGVTEDECCNGVDSANLGIATCAYSPDLESGQLFYYRALRGGVPCTPCKSSCEGVQCGTGKKCVLKDNRQPVCICAPKCSRRRRRMGSVCGSDGRTYRHICRLLKRKCRKDSTLSVEYYGNCGDSCDSVRCPESKTCILDHNLKPHCVRCRESCPLNANSRAVCGVNNKTYSSYCHLQRSACLSGTAIQVAYRGQCKRNANCGSITCNQNKKCLKDVNNHNQPRCVTCPMPCPPHLMASKDSVDNKLLCASNNMTYANWCSMMNEACSTGTYLQVVAGGPCPANDGLALNDIDQDTYIPNTILKMSFSDKFRQKR